MSLLHHLLVNMCYCSVTTLHVVINFNNTSHEPALYCVFMTMNLSFLMAELEIRCSDFDSEDLQSIKNPTVPL